MADPINNEEDGRMPRWVKLFAIIGSVAILLVAVIMFAGHGPGNHAAGNHVQAAGNP